MLVVTVRGLKLKFLMKFSLCVTNILKLTRMLEEFHIYELRGGAASHQCEWIEHMAIKVLSKKKLDTRVVSGSVCVVTSFITRNNWFNATSNLRFHWSFVTITLR